VIRCAAVPRPARHRPEPRATRRGRIALCVGLAALACACASTPPATEPARFDPVCQDPPADPAHPARLAEGIAFVSHGAHMNAILYEAAGAGPHPTAIVLHGFPGNERNLDLAQALRRAGWNIVFFHYRGTWGSGGSFSFGNVLEDVAAVLAQVRDPAFARAHRIDPAHVVLIGHSMGGFAALMLASESPDVACAVSLAGANLGRLAASLADPATATRTAHSFEEWGGGPIRNLSGAQLVAELRKNGERFDLTRRAAALARKPVLLVAGSRDTVARPEQNHAPLADAIAAQPGARLSQVVLDDDHAFSGSRIALTRAVLDFLTQECSGAPG
jgi:pimeloyl-ACP methyl ester carboxylesterase